jgi:hypothetical protein
MASASEEKVADLRGAELVAHLSSTHRRTDFEAVASILVERDRRNAEVQAEFAAALADLDAASARDTVASEVKADLEAARMGVDALREKYSVLLDEMALVVGATVPDAVLRDDSGVEEAEEREVKDIDFINLCSDEEEDVRVAGGSEEEDEEDTEPLSQRVKRLRGAKPGELEGSGKVDVRGQSNLVGTLGNDQQKSSSVKTDALMAGTGKMVSKPEDSKVAAFVQESPVVNTENSDGEMPRTMLLPSQGLLVRSAIQEGSSTSDYSKSGIGDKGRFSDGVPARGVTHPSKGIAETNKTPMVESSAKCENKEVGAEKPRITRDVVPFEPCNGGNTYAQVKKEMGSLPSAITTKWESEGHLITSLLDKNNIEVCMQALCALYRQGKLSTVDKRVESRYVKLPSLNINNNL